MNEFEAGRQVEKHSQRLSVIDEQLKDNTTDIAFIYGSLRRINAELRGCNPFKKLSRWWNRSHYRALEQQLSELRTHQMKTDEAVSKLTETQENQAKTIANLVEGNAEINALVAGLKTEIDALKEAANNAEIPENIAALIAGLATSSAEAKDRSQEIADIVKPTEPPAQG